MSSKRSAVLLVALAATSSVLAVVGSFLYTSFVDVAVLVALLSAVAGIGVLLTGESRQAARRDRHLRQSVAAHRLETSAASALLLDLLKEASATQVAERAGAPDGMPAVLDANTATPSQPVAAAASAGTGWKNHPLVDDLLATGLFDADYYRAVALARFARDRDAASHYLSIGLPNLQSPSPFIEVALLPEPVRAAMRGGDAAALLQHLRSSTARESPLSDWFDPRELDLPFDAVAHHPGGALGVFLETLDDQTTLPAPPGAHTRDANARQARQALLTHASDVAHGRRLSGSRESATWDEAAERTWLDSVRAAADGDHDHVVVSVVMPVRDRAVQVVDAIRSVQQQTHTRWELLVVDDGSTDGTLEVLQRHSERDSRIRVLENPDQGVANARNTGLQHATGSYVAFLDSDNEWVSHFLDTMLAGLLAGPYRAAYSAASLVRENGLVSFRAYQGGLDHLRLLNHIDLNVLVLETDLARKAGGFDPQFRRWIDHDFALRVAAVTEPCLFPFIGCHYHHSALSTDRITVRESENWQWPVLGKAWVPWDERAASPRVPGRLSVIIPTYGDSTLTIEAVTSVLRDDSHGDVEVLVVDNGSNMNTGQAIVRTFVGAPRVRYLRLPRNYNFAIGCNYGALHSTGELLFFLNNDTVLRAGALAPLVRRIQDDSVSGVQSLLVYPDETIQTAGTVFIATDSLPCHFLTGHPASDAETVDRLGFSAVTAAALLLRAQDFVSVQGFDPIFVNGMEDVDLCLRLTAHRGGHFAVEPASRVTHLESKTPGRGAKISENRRIFLGRWTGALPPAQPGHYEEVGFTLAHTHTDGAVPPGPKPIVIRSATSPGRRWGLKISSIPGPRGDLWGDTHFADSLGASLRRAGESVAVHRHSAHEVPATMFDDVVLSLRGLTRVTPIPGKVNVLWVISHPEMVTAEEMRGFDLVFAASKPWAERMSTETGVVVRPLLQATDTRRFNLGVPPYGRQGPVFVGGVHPSRPRQIVLDAVEAGVPVSVYGPGWSGTVPGETHKGDYVDNDQLCAVYRGSSRVLAHHWRDMADEGFMQNRLFDAAASGCRVVSDPVEGLEDVFGGAVQVYRSRDELAELCSDEGLIRFPSDEDLGLIARRISAEHSFDRRAQELIEAVEELARRT